MPLHTPAWRHLQRCAAIAVTLFLIAACAANPWANKVKDAQNPSFTGRMSLQVDSEPVQSFAGGFELQGSAEMGELSLYTPLGSTVAVLRWAPGQAALETGGTTQAYPSVQAMMERTTGAAVPVPALFAWLRGEAVDVPGWVADVSRQAQGRINAQRTSPLPSAQLRIVLGP